MPIIFENIDTGETVGISRDKEGLYYKAKLSAVLNSSNLNVNADRGQDFGWRLAPEQQALIEEWEADPAMIDRVSNWTKVMVDDLTHSDFLQYLLYQQELGTNPEKREESIRREKQRDYETRVAALRAGKVEAMPAFNPKVARGEATLEDFMNGDLTGDAGGDKVEEVEVTEDSLAELDKVIDEVEGKPAADTAAETPKTPAKKPASKK